MPQQPLDYQGHPQPPIAEDFARFFRRAAYVIALAMNTLLMLASLHDVFPRGRLGIQNELALLIAFLWSPILNGLLLLIGVVLGLICSAKGPRRWRGYLFAAVSAPLIGASANLVLVLTIVPWHGPGHGY